MMRLPMGALGEKDCEKMFVCLHCVYSLKQIVYVTGFSFCFIFVQCVSTIRWNSSEEGSLQHSKINSFAHSLPSTFVCKQKKRVFFSVLFLIRKNDLMSIVYIQSLKCISSSLHILYAIFTISIFFTFRFFRCC